MSHLLDKSCGIGLHRYNPAGFPGAIFLDVADAQYNAGPGLGLSGKAWREVQSPCAGRLPSQGHVGVYRVRGMSKATVEVYAICRP
jgi:hypothetical protein